MYIRQAILKYSNPILKIKVHFDRQWLFLLQSYCLKVYSVFCFLTTKMELNDFGKKEDALRLKTLFQALLCNEILLKAAFQLSGFCFLTTKMELNDFGRKEDA